MQMERKLILVLANFFILTLSKPVFAVDNNSLVAHWKLNEGSGNIVNDSASGCDGELINGPTWTEGKIGDYALDFDGLDDYVQGSDSPFDFEDTTFTVSLWMQKTETAQVLISEGSYNGGWQISDGSHINPGGIKVLLKKKNSIADALQIITEDKYDDGQWHHVVAVIKTSTTDTQGNNAEIYADGCLVPVVEHNRNYPYGAADDNWRIGARPVSPHYFGGLIDDIRIYSDALTTAEIERLYQQGQTEPPVSFHIDGVNGDNNNDGLTRETAFKTIQTGINEANDGDTLLVWPAVYTEEILFEGKAITVKSAGDAAMLRTDYGRACSFCLGEGSSSVLKNFVIADSEYGVYLESGSTPTLENLTVVNCDYGVAAYESSDPNIRNCIFWNNHYHDLFQCNAQHSWSQKEQTSGLNLIGWWKLDESSGTTAYDSAGSNDGTIHGATWTTGKFGQALDFDGDNDYVDLGHHNYGPDIGFTWSVWINTEDSTQLNQSILVHSDTASAEDMRLSINDIVPGTDGFAFIVDPVGGDHHTNDIVTWNPAGGVQNGIWYHIAGVMDYTNMIIKLYVDGSLKDLSDWIGTPLNRAMYAAIGTSTIHWPSPERFFNGRIDDVQIYSDVLSSQEVQAIYQGYLPDQNCAEVGFADANAGDYHLKSERGRYWPEHDIWVLDDVTSACIDAGDPNTEPIDEPMPNGGRVNIGAYGGTPYASMSKWPLKHDSNQDGVVNFADFAQIADEWLQTLLWSH